ncbi:MAG: hypothetical protein M3186_17935, partial [Actinomycetota bacterium]|nr:hypothetical protein [Actinomycetota bacterium]
RWLAQWRHIPGGYTGRDEFDRVVESNFPMIRWLAQEQRGLLDTDVVLGYMVPRTITARPSNDPPRSSTGWTDRPRRLHQLSRQRRIRTVGHSVPS